MKFTNLKKTRFNSTSHSSQVSDQFIRLPGGLDPLKTLLVHPSSNELRLSAVEASAKIAILHGSDESVRRNMQDMLLPMIEVHTFPKLVISNSAIEKGVA